MSDWMMGTLADNDADEARSAAFDADFDFDGPDAQDIADLEADAEEATPLDPDSPWTSPAFIGPVEEMPF